MLKSRHGYAGIICVGGDGIVNEVLEHDPCASVVQFKNPLLHCWEVVVCAFSVSGSRACCHAFLFCCLFGLVLQTFASHESLKRSGDCRYSMGS
jgi:hypothetical protein